MRARLPVGSRAAAASLGRSLAGRSYPTIALM